MERFAGLSFSSLHHFLSSKGLAGAGYGIPQTPFYTYLFHADIAQLTIRNGKIFTDHFSEARGGSKTHVNKSGAESSDNDNNPSIRSMNEYFSRCCTGSRLLKEDFLSAVMLDPLYFMATLRDKLKEVYRILETDIPETLEEELIPLIDKDLLKIDTLQSIDYRYYSDTCDLLSYAFLEALSNDYVKQQINVDMLKAIQTADQSCKSRNFPMKSPYLLLPFIQRGDSILINSVERLKKGYGDTVANSIIDYCRNSHSGTHPYWSVMESEEIIYAKKYAYNSNLTMAGEREIILSLLLTKSNTIRQIAGKVGGEHVLRHAIMNYGRYDTTPLKP